MTSLDWIIAVRDIPRGGLVIDRAFEQDALQQLAGDLDILAIQQLKISGRITARSGGRYRLAGTMKAAVTQACVVSLEPVEGTIYTPLDIEFAPADAQPIELRLEVTESLLEEQDTDIIENGEINLGRVLYEELVTNLDPFPRHPDVALEQTEAGNSEGNSGPFAELARLKRQGESE